jgi:hypothetical protein
MKEEWGLSQGRFELIAVSRGLVGPSRMGQGAAIKVVRIGFIRVSRT